MAIVLTPRIHYYLLAGGALLLIAALVSQHGGVESLKQAWQNQNPPADSESSSSAGKHPHSSNLQSFYDVAYKYGTDKVTDHHYWFMYDKYLPAVRGKRVKFLEIGLGCDMSYGPGKSYYTWLEYFPDVDLYYIEYDAECAEKWAHKTTDATIVTGDQSDSAFLERFMQEHGTDFDIIVDDGGHTMTQQMVSLRHLWRAVRPGGIYFCEDLQTSFMPPYGGDDAPTEGWRGVGTMLAFVYELISDKMRSGSAHASITADLRSVDCDREICAFIKKETGSV